MAKRQIESYRGAQIELRRTLIGWSCYRIRVPGTGPSAASPFDKPEMELGIDRVAI